MSETAKLKNWAVLKLTAVAIGVNDTQLCFRLGSGRGKVWEELHSLRSVEHG